MIISRIYEINEQMNHLKKKEQERNDIEKLKEYQVKFQSLVNDVNQLIENISYLKNVFDFVVDEKLLEQLFEFVTKLDCMTNLNNLSDTFLTEKIEDYKTIRQAINKIWFSFRSKNILVNIQSTLNIVKKMNPDQVSIYLDHLKLANKVDVKHEELIKFYNAVEESKDFINGLNMKPEVVDFLGKMNNGKARFGDLNEDVILWIKENGLERKIKLSF